MTKRYKTHWGSIDYNQWHCLLCMRCDATIVASGLDTVLLDPLWHEVCWGSVNMTVMFHKIINPTANLSQRVCWCLSVQCELAFKGLFHHKTNILSLITRSKPIKALDDILDENQEVCDCPIDYQVINTEGKDERHRQNSPSAISGSIWMLWSDENIFSTQGK